MSDRVILAGRITLAKQAFDAIQHAPILGMLVYDDTSDDGAPILHHFTPVELSSAIERSSEKHKRNTFDARLGTWTFAFPLEGDDWWNAFLEGLRMAVATHKTGTRPEFVISYNVTSRGLEQVLIVTNGTVAPLEPPPELTESIRTLLEAGKLEKALDLIEPLLASALAAT